MIERREPVEPFEVFGFKVVAFFRVWGEEDQYGDNCATIGKIHVLVAETDRGEGYIIANYSSDDRRFAPIGPFKTPSEALMMATLMKD